MKNIIKFFHIYDTQANNHTHAQTFIYVYVSVYVSLCLSVCIKLSEKIIFELLYNNTFLYPTFSYIFQLYYVAFLC